VFGGTFDPIHLGHLMVAGDVHEALGLDKTIFVPVGVPPHRPNGTVLEAEHRLRLVEVAVAGDERFTAWDGEVRRSGPSYTVDTLEELRAEHGGHDLFLTIGADQHAVFSTWHRPERILELATVVVVERDGLGIAASENGDRQSEEGLSAPHRVVQARRVDVSATEVRERLSAGRPIRNLVPESVRRIIEENNWYKGG